MKNHNKIKYNLGFSLVEIVVVVSILTILSLGVFTFHNFLIKEEMKARREANIKITIDSIKNTLMADYKFNRGDNPVMSAGPHTRCTIQPNITPLMLQNANENNTYQRDHINSGTLGTRDRKWDTINLALPFPLTKSELEGRESKFNTKFFTIQQLIQSGTNRISRKIYYTMSCIPLPQNIINIFRNHNTNLATLLNNANFYNQTKCIRENGIYTTTLDNDQYNIDDNSCITSNSDNTSVIRRDVWDNGKWTNFNTSWTYGTKQSSQFFPSSDSNSIGIDTVLGVAFCMWIPSENDIITANTTEIELYYYMLDINSISNPNTELNLEVRKERLSLHRQASTSTGIFPLKEE